jgi:alpha-beta hydrolase superfamily lysophospholipase
MVQAQTPSSWLPDVLTRVAVASGVGYLAASYSISRWLTRPSPGRPQIPAHDFPWSCERTECRTVDGLRLVGWVVEPPRPRATVALFHGMRYNRAQTLPRVCWLAAEGYRCVAFDHRAHGESGGKRTSFGFYESRDVLAVLDRIRTRWPHQPRAALGLSMGAAALCYAASLGEDWHALILESCYQDIGQAFRSRLRRDYPPAFQRLAQGVVWVTERRLRVRLAQLAPVEHIGHLADTPVLILTGTDDPHASPAEAEQLYHHCRGPRELWLVPQAGHRDVFERGGAEYRSRVLDFLERRLARPLAA